MVCKFSIHASLETQQCFKNSNTKFSICKENSLVQLHQGAYKYNSLPGCIALHLHFAQWESSTQIPFQASSSRCQQSWMGALEQHLPCHTPPPPTVTVSASHMTLWHFPFKSLSLTWILKVSFTSDIWPRAHHVDSSSLSK